MKIPKNCNECSESKKGCRAVFGGLGCKHKDSIRKDKKTPN